MKLRLMGQDILDVRADACVSPVHSSKYLKLGALSRYISEKGGHQIQEELSTRDAGQNLKCCEIVKTGSGSLDRKFDYLIFACLSTWNGKNETDIAKVVYRCCQLASCNESKSIVFPCLGTGNLLFPERESYSGFLNGLVLFTLDHPLSCLETVYVSLYGKSPSCMMEWNSNCAEVIQQWNKDNCDEINGINFVGVTGNGSSKDDTGTEPQTLKPSKARNEPSARKDSPNTPRPVTVSGNSSTAVTPWLPLPGWLPLLGFPSVSMNLGAVEAGATSSTNARVLNDGVEVDLSLRLRLRSSWVAMFFKR